MSNCESVKPLSFINYPVSGMSLIAVGEKTNTAYNTAEVTEVFSVISHLRNFSNTLIFGIRASDSVDLW